MGPYHFKKQCTVECSDHQRYSAWSGSITPCTWINERALWEYVIKKLITFCDTGRDIDITIKHWQRYLQVDYSIEKLAICCRWFFGHPFNRRRIVTMASLIELLTSPDSVNASEYLSSCNLAFSEVHVVEFAYRFRALVFRLLELFRAQPTEPLHYPLLRP